MLTIVESKVKTSFGNSVFYVVADGHVQGELVADAEMEPTVFNRIYEGNGMVLHQSDAPPNPFFVGSWGEVFSNPELVPTGTKNIFVDPKSIGGFETEWQERA